MYMRMFGVQMTISGIILLVVLSTFGEGMGAAKTLGGLKLT